MRIVVAYAPGGGNDTIARLIGAFMRSEIARWQKVADAAGIRAK